MMNRKQTKLMMVYFLGVLLLFLSLFGSTALPSFANAADPTPDPHANLDDELSSDSDDESNLGDTCEVDVDDEDDYFNQLIVKLDPDVRDPAETLALLTQQYDVTSSETALASRHIYLLNLEDEMDDAEDIDDDIDEQWGDSDGDGINNGVVYVEPHYTGDVPESDYGSAWVWGGHNDEPADTQYAFNLLSMNGVHNVTTGEGVTVAVIDTGVQLDHPHFINADGTSPFVDGWDFVNDDPDPSELYTGTITNGVGHGTHVAGIIHTVAPSAKIMPIRALAVTGEGAVYVIAEAILYAAENGAHIINLSLGTTYDSDLLNEAVEIAVQEYDVLIVAAAGNSNSCRPHYPAAFNEDDAMTLAVTSVGQNGGRAASATYGDWIDIAAPGEQIFSAIVDPSRPNGYAWWSGTSMATPFIAGEAALLMPIMPTASLQHLRTEILGATSPIDPASDQIELMGAGIADIGTAVFKNGSAVPTQVQLTNINLSNRATSYAPLWIFGLLFGATTLLDRR